jgi:hypothetical protein
VRRPLTTWRDIPGHFDFDDVYGEAVARVSSEAHFVEIGTLFGKSACFMADAIRASGKQIRFDAVDPFKWNMCETRNATVQALAPSRNPSTDTELWNLLVAQGTSLGAACYCVTAVGLHAFMNLIPSSGQERASCYADCSLDFAFIDAEHTYADTSELLRLYLPKVKLGGVLAGHDYNPLYPGVVQAVHDVLGQNRVETRKNCFVHQKI